MGRKIGLALLLLFIFTAAPARLLANAFVGYSFKAAEQKLRAGNSSSQLLNMGGISRLIGFVLDSDRDDLIIVGQSVPGERVLTLDDLVVALRASMVLQEWPEVSIEGRQENSPDGSQMVRFQGGIANTHFGKDLLEADVLLKQLALNLRPLRILGLESYFSMRASELKRSPTTVSMKTKFWFYPKDKQRGSREGVFVLRNFRPGIEARLEGLNVADNAAASPDISSQRNETADEFASRLTANFAELSIVYPQIARVHALLRLVALAEGIKSLPKRPNLQYWLSEYPLERVQTPATYHMLEHREKISAENTAELHMEGGVSLRVLLSRLSEDGDIEALRSIVLGARPDGDPLSWEIPLGNWCIPGYDDDDHTDDPKDANTAGYFRAAPGFSLSERVLSPGVNSRGVLPSLSSPVSTLMPQFETYSSILPQRQAARVGGVMLSGAAKVGGGSENIDLADGKFSLIVNGENARPDPQVFRKFVTALWSVYFSRQDPGISIDPISMDPETGGFSEKHLVRYIGRVVNTDLGRVMREADYQMKKWSVGTEKAGVPGFRSPDEIAGRSGTRYLSLSRFWLVPEDMKFRSADNMLLYDGGRMTVKTEVLGTDASGHKPADPYNERFAQFFTQHYGEIAQKYPVYQELFDYAKLVALAKYLKESGIPLFWFLMANKDLVITEDSPGTVDNLVKGSDYWRGLTIQGGVDLATKGDYVFDAAAVKAINEAAEKAASRPERATSLSGSGAQSTPIPFSFGLGSEKYSVAPQHSQSAGRDRHGILYQTDLALRAEGYMVTADLLNTLRSEMIRQDARRILAPEIEKLSQSEIGSKADSLVNAALEQASRQVEPLVKKMESLKDREFKNEAECARAWDDAMGSDAADWRPFFVKQAHYSSDLQLVRYFNPRQRESGEFGMGWRLLIPYQVRPADKATVSFQDVMVPKQMEIENLITGTKEVLTFSTDRYTAAGYVPDRIESSQFVGLFLLSNASFRLVDKIGSEYQFDQAGFLTDLVFSDDHRMHIEYAGESSDAFSRKPYALEPAGSERIAFLNAQIPKSMKLTDLIHNQAEVLTFSSEGRIAGYVPSDAAKSRYKILALMSDASFRLLDTWGNEVSFSSSGEFERMAIEPRTPKSISMGNHKIDFGYTIDQTGRALIASAGLSKDVAGAVATHSIRYEYDSEGRLARAERGKIQAAEGQPPGEEGRETAAASSGQ